jgi:hypothetical protein
MSAGAVFQATLRIINRMSLPADAQKDVVTAMEAGRTSLTMLYSMGYDAGLEHEALMARAAALFLGFCAGNLADDLVDGDCTYLEPPIRIGPGLQYLLQHASLAALCDAGLPSETLGRAARDLVTAAGEHQSEVRTTTWDAPRYHRICSAIAGRQWAGYLRLLWHDTKLAPLAEEVGLGLGEVGNISEDIRSKDRRFFDMPLADQRQVAGWAKDTLAKLRAHEIPSIELMARSVGPILAQIGG